MNKDYFLTVLLLPLLLAQICNCESYVVDTTADPPYTIPLCQGFTCEGSFTLRMAIAAANNHVGPDEISMNVPNSAGRVDIFEPLFITDDLTIKSMDIVALNEYDYRMLDVASGVHLTLYRTYIRSGLPPAGKSQVDKGRIMYVHPGATISLTISSLSDGYSAVAGGSLYHDHGILVLMNGSFVRGTTLGDGGGIYNDGGTISGQLSSASGHAGGDGGAIYNNGGDVVLGPSTYSFRRCTAGGKGGAIYSNGGSVSVTGYNFYENTATNGGAISVAGDAVMEMSSCSFYQNNSDAYGGAVFAEAGTLRMTNCSLSENAAVLSGGAAFQYGGLLKLLNCTLTKNTATENNGGGISIFGGACRIGNTVIAANTAHATGQDVLGHLLSTGHNYVGDGDASDGYHPTDLVGTQAAPLDPQLQYRLRAEEGTRAPYYQYAPLSGSPLIDAGDNALLLASEIIGSTCLDSFLHARVRGIAVDIGSAELQEGEITPTCTGTYAADFDHDQRINLAELLRAIQLYNAREYHCERNLEDNFAPGPGDRTCAPHTADNNPQDWTLSLAELLRIIQFYATGGYHPCPGEDTEDGFCPGA